MVMISPDGKRNVQDNPVEDLLAAHADALLAERDDFGPQFGRYGIAPSQVAEMTELLHLAQQLRDSLTPVALSGEFVRHLKNELVGEQPVTLFVRWRKLPPHYQLAAKLGGLTIGAGIVLLATRRALEVLDALHRRNQPEADKGLSLTAS
jgi:hypothetical protein